MGHLQDFLSLHDPLGRASSLGRPNPVSYPVSFTFTPWMFRHLDVSPPRRFAPPPGRFAIRTFHPLTGRFAPDCGRFAHISGRFAPACKL